MHRGHLIQHKVQSEPNLFEYKSQILTQGVLTDRLHGITQ